MKNGKIKLFFGKYLDMLPDNHEKVNTLIQDPNKNVFMLFV